MAAEHDRAVGTRTTPIKPAGLRALLRVRGRELFIGRAVCLACHKISALGTQIKGPNLGVGDGMSEPISVRGAKRIGNLSAIEYIVSSIVDPDAYIVNGYVRGVMSRVDGPPFNLGEQDIVALAVFLAGVDRAEPVTAAEIDRARARIPLARQMRTLRLQAARNNRKSK